jgi:hypothetical protein
MSNTKKGTVVVRREDNVVAYDVVALKCAAAAPEDVRYEANLVAQEALIRAVSSGWGKCTAILKVVGQVPTVDQVYVANQGNIIAALRNVLYDANRIRERLQIPDEYPIPIDFPLRGREESDLAIVLSQLVEGWERFGITFVNGKLPRFAFANQGRSFAKVVDTQS